MSSIGWDRELTICCNASLRGLAGRKPKPRHERFQLKLPAAPPDAEAKTLSVAPGRCLSFDHDHLPGLISAVELVDAQPPGPNTDSASAPPVASRRAAWVAQARVTRKQPLPSAGADVGALQPPNGRTPISQTCSQKVSAAHAARPTTTAVRSRVIGPVTYSVPAARSRRRAEA
jgi:hypothetical protein